MGKGNFLLVVRIFKSIFVPVLSMGGNVFQSSIIRIIGQVVATTKV